MKQSQQHKDSNFDFLRFSAAVMVVISHSYWLHGSHNSESLITGEFGIGLIAVYMFFIISGFLVTSSWKNSRDNFSFVIKRLLRIIPALIVATLFTVFIIGSFVTELPLAEYYFNNRTWKYLSNLVFWIQFDLPGVFTGNPFPNIVNGSIWTLPFVLLMDISLLCFAVSGMLQPTIIVTGLVTLILTNIALLTFTEVDSKSIINLITLGTFFYFGVTLYLFYERVPWNKTLALVLTSVLLLGLTLKLGSITLVIALPYLTIYVAYLRIPRLSHFGRYGDFSYGIYLFGFPMQQLIIHWLDADSISISAFIALSLIVSFTMGVLSFYLIERPSLALKRYLSQRSIDKNINLTIVKK
ncbi:acyltransferase family protein [Azomonas macrocytogenes]|uniref:Peptidoglycan/LPS O-acetylase OafA/YrhL n=1 Tax=Azomonas macrocytogenes TaxID=69962 RepID=A0A839TBJ0_AZOMA|nr:acyltransferase [Azomonas macrocytogenes]MBB3105425.1 peptidoglycan/LPS O-acetylase OafA/YrhL [Azomonas macrocytogenes]